MKFLRVLLAVAFLPGLLFATTNEEDLEKIKGSYSTFINTFPKKRAGQTVAYSGGAGGVKAKAMNLNKVSPEYYNQVAQSNYAKAQIMNSLGTLAQALANTAGSAYATQSATTARQQAAALSGSSDQQFQQMGQMFKQEANAIESNNRVLADNTASQIQDMPRPYVAPNYQPTQSDNFLVQAFNLAIGGIVTSMSGVLGGVAVSSLLQSLGINFSGGSSFGQNLGQGFAGAAYNNQNPAPAMNNATGGAVLNGGAQIQNQIYQVPSLQQPQGATNSGKLPGS